MNADLFPLKTKHFFIRPRNDAAPFEEGLSVSLKGDDREVGCVRA